MIEACRRPIMFELTHTVDLPQVKAAVLAGVRSEMADWDVATVEREGDEVPVELLRLKVGVQPYSLTLHHRDEPATPAPAATPALRSMAVRAQSRPADPAPRR
jgi:hypothetical protein